MKRLLFILCALLLLVGCGDNSEADGGTVTIAEPSQRILGKWKEIARWNDYNPKLTPNETVIEFLPDRTYYGPFGFYLGRTDGEPSYYRIESDSLYLERKEQPGQIYRCIFTDNNQFFVEHVHGYATYSMLTPKFHIFKRIK
ncbi:MAG: hypothetical protein LBP25_01315 [Tannerellaceae bacterium]|jgi:hypothetical protein|nr:hypothetical protein [Tannerellaceae bacterium]